MPQNKLEGDVVVMGENVIAPVNLLESVPPKVSSPFVTDADVVGSNETPISSDVIVPCENRLSVTVGIRELVFGLSVPKVRSTGPIPRIPSTPWNPVLVVATPMLCFEITKPGARVTWSMNSLPEKEPEPYVTLTASPVAVVVDVDVKGVVAPTQVLEEPVSTIRLKSVGGLPTPTVAVYVTAPLVTGTPTTASF